MKTRWVMWWMMAGALSAAGAELAIPVEWLRSPPAEKEARLIEDGAERHGWSKMSGALRTGALEAYSRGNYTAAEAWAGVTRWAEWWAAPVAEEEARWSAAMQAEGLGRGEVEQGRDAPGTKEHGQDARATLADLVPEGLRVRLLADGEGAAEFFARESPLDRRAEVMRILARLFAHDAEAFWKFNALARAIALVHDVAPPRDWPHWQVSEQALPRWLAAAEEVFDYFRGLEGGLWDLEKLETAELRFLVDLALPAEERAWARERTRAPLGKLAETYSMIGYRMERVETGTWVWPGERYRLEDILREGGICVDQAYFASQAGKARGAPTLLFAGAGRDGRHAWFGYLGVGRRWVMDAGRYEAQNYVTGVAHDPQTWTAISDHELAFLSEGVWRERNAREARIHALFARWMREAGRAREAEAAARRAVKLERRVVEAWEELLALRAEPGPAREAVAREAAAGLSSYADLQARFLGVAVESLRARGEDNEADRLGREMARRFAGKRSDLSVKEIAGRMERAVATQAVDEQVRLYRELMRSFGRGAGAGMWDEVARPFVSALAAGGRWKEARAALALARETLGGGYGSQIDAEMRAVDALLVQAEAAAAARR